MKKLASILALLLAMVMILSACSKNDSKSSSDSSASDAAKPNTIEGTWKVAEVKPSTTDEALLRFVKEMNERLADGSYSEEYMFKDGTITLKSTDRKEGLTEPVITEETASYKIEGDKITVIFPDGSPNSTTSFKLSSDTLELTVPDQGTTVLIRVK